MAESADEKLKGALTEFLGLFDIKLDIPEEERSDAAIKGQYGEVVKATQDKLDEYNIKAEEVLQKTGMTREELDAYASNQDNFSSEQWQALQKLREATEELRRRTYKVVGEENLKKSIEKERGKQAHRFGKKKDWLPL